jgi:hypothetical protein
VSVNTSLIQGIRNRLGAAIDLGTTTSTATSDLFEFYIFSILIRAARNEGATIHYRNVSGNIATALIFRQSPGQIYGTTHPYTHAVLDFGNNKPLLEAHIGIKVQGKAQIAHECDVCVLHQQEADNCRSNRREPRSSKVVIAAECKHYTSDLKLDLARSFIGLSSVLIRLEGDCYFISNTFSDKVAKLLATERKRWALNLIPGSTNNLNKLMYTFQNDFQDFKAKY